MASFNAWISAAVAGGGAGAAAGDPLAGAAFDADSVCAQAPAVNAARIRAVRNRFLLDFMEVDFLLLNSFCVVTESRQLSYKSMSINVLEIMANEQLLFRCR